ncbi:TPA: flagellar biosynthesis protein FlgA [bacterium]|nr:flagellar biosynthesis protein FlgA [bacterium]
MDILRIKIFIFGLIASSVFTIPPVSIRDITTIKGMQANQIIGYGLVIGLNGTGDSKGTFFTANSIANLLAHFGIYVDKTKMRVKNVAAVLVTAELSPFSRQGSRISVDMSSIGDCKDLSGGILIQTPLLGPDGIVYAIAQGPVSLGGTGKVKNPTVCKIPDGAVVERDVVSEIFKNKKISLFLNSPSFKTASSIAQAINIAFGDIAKAADPSLVEIETPDEFKDNPVSFISMIQSLQVKPDQQARVVINEKTGTIVMGEDIKISPVAISHGNLSLVIEEEEKERRENVIYLKEGISIKDIIQSLNAIGTTPSDLIAILQALKAAGALFAEIVVM